jgi:hypothetical protein
MPRVLKPMTAWVIPEPNGVPEFDPTDI